MYGSVSLSKYKREMILWEQAQKSETFGDCQARGWLKSRTEHSIYSVEDYEVHFAVDGLRDLGRTGL
jgi:hypothetical protein